MGEKHAQFACAGRRKGRACRRGGIGVWDWQDLNLRPLVPKTRIMPC